MKILVTAGGTTVPIDSVRKITNMSTGRFGADIALAALEAGHEVTLLRNKTGVSLFNMLIKVIERRQSPPSEILRDIEDRQRLLGTGRLSEIAYDTYDEYNKKLQSELGYKNFDMVFASAAVSDYGLTPFEGKMDSSQPPVLQLKKLEKVLPKIREQSPKSKVVGFKLLVNCSAEELAQAANKTLIDGQCDMVVGNDIKEIRSGYHNLTLFFKDEDSIFLKGELNQSPAKKLFEMAVEKLKPKPY